HTKPHHELSATGVFPEYFPVSEFHLTFSNSTNMRIPSRSGLILPSFVCAHLTAISWIRKPRFFARYRISGSKPQRSICCQGKMDSAARRVNALKPHCVSLKFKPRI